MGGNKLKRYWKIIVVILVIASIPVLYFWKQRTEYARMDREAEELLREKKNGPVLPGENGLPMLVELGSETCIPCRQMQPIIEALKKEYAGRITVQFVNIYDHPEWIDRYKIYAIPTQIFFNAEGKEVFRHLGFFPQEDIVKKFKELGWI